MVYESYSCVKPECEMYGQYELGNISHRCTYGKENDRELLYCKKCGQRFSAESQTLFQYTRLSKRVVYEILNCLCSRMGIRATERHTGIHRDTIMSLKKYSARHFKEVNHILVNNLEVSEVQLDEFWSFVKKKRQKPQKKKSN